MNCAFADSVLSRAASPRLLSPPLVKFQAFIALGNKVLGLHGLAPGTFPASTAQCSLYCHLTSMVLGEGLHVCNLNNKGYHPYWAVDKSDV